jgi:hypothetical protein
MAIPRFDGAAAIFENGVWGAWDELEINGGFSSVSCPAVSFCVVVNGAGQAFTYGAPPTAPPTTGGAGGTTGSPSMNPPIAKGKPLVNAKTGEITLEYDFPEPGEAEAYGEVIDRAVVAAKHKRTNKCKKRHTTKDKSCVDNTPVHYRRTRLAIDVAGTYKLHIKPGGKVLAALRKGKTLTVRVVLIFTPAGTTDHIQETTTVRVRLGKRTKAAADHRRQGSRDGSHPA